MSAEPAAYICGRIEALQRELEELKGKLLHEARKGKPKPGIKGLWHGLKVSESDIARARRELSKHAQQFK